MADNKTANDVQQALEQQVSELRGELKRLSKSLASRTSDLRDTAEDALMMHPVVSAMQLRLCASVVKPWQKQSRKTLALQQHCSVPQASWAS